MAKAMATHGRVSRTRRTRAVSTPGRGERVVIGGIAVNNLSSAQWCALLLDDWKSRKPGDKAKVVTTINGQVLSLSGSDMEFKAALEQADDIAADGMSVVKASKRYARYPLVERVATTDWYHDAARAAAAVGMRFYIVGATKDVNDRAIAEVRRLYPTLRIVGHRDGYFSDDDIAQIAQDVDAAGADVLWLGIGNPRQLIVAHKLRALLNNVTWVRTCGGLFDHLAGVHSRAPKFIQNIGFEWAWRVALEPRRLFWRYLTTNVHAAYLMHKYSERSRDA
ncbi:WecB/TagA/CpsF family glycosyltransferase [Sphingobium sp. KCTC 72723]|uniref:WecB/TagA/CpsF family glycosyltransferase n=1 Tax=Sphingobium sp. KCTC 72723 TaxID=2733867 RepID=UPI00165D7B17|nr:WecB/TagA/CpsF family glycosyltransferase [Sphingobium sp. KCTC 72723]